MGIIDNYKVAIRPLTSQNLRSQRLTIKVHRTNIKRISIKHEFIEKLTIETAECVHEMCP